ncbi:NUDIX hydrolase [Citrobacter sp. NCU1]|uniref:NUDIX hydrolase n=1 Tax=Citrobacter sp. NCU1 TaxID=2026683 RepID=UPI00139187A3|nr:NUDIX hydrolase [Citrobacter sp. NCU1]NDO80208.1 NUDIX hydrolase [Citrobacter sp. NCU1]
MPLSEDLKAKLLAVLGEGATPDDILLALNELPTDDLSKVKDNKPDMRTAAADEDQNLMTEAQVKADSAYRALGKTAPSPFSGEKAMDYRKRVLIGAQRLAKDFSGVNIRSVSDSATLSVLEDQIYKAAREGTEWAMENTPGYLHKTVRMDEAGRRITEYQGDPNVWLSAFKTPGRILSRINTQGSIR